MSGNRQYLLVGAFVVIASTFLVSVWLWMSSSNRQSYDIYKTVFHEPVDGISNNSVIKYNGVEVGKVKQVELDKVNPNNIYIYLNIVHGTPVSKETVAMLKSQGITGMSYIDLRLPESALSTVLLKQTDKVPYPEIPTKPSLLYSLSSQAQSVATNVQDVSVSLTKLFDEENLAHVANTLKNLDRVTQTLADHSDAVGKSLDTLEAVLVNIRDNSVKLNQTFENLSTLTKSLSKTSDNTNKLVVSFQDNTMQNINSVLLPNLNQTIIHLNQSSSQLERLLGLLNNNPSALIRGAAPAPKGPGE